MSAEDAVGTGPPGIKSTDLKFIVDKHFPIAFIRWIALQGCVAVSLRDLSLSGNNDADIWDAAERIGAVIVTKDADFSERRKRETSGLQIVWIRWGNLRKAALLSRLPTAWPAVVTRLQAGDAIVEVM